MPRVRKSDRSIYQSFLEVLCGISINLTSGWFGILIISPGLFKVSSSFEYAQFLTINLSFGILGLLTSVWLTEKSKKV